MAITDYSRYEGRKLRTQFYKQLKDDLSLVLLSEILGCSYDDLEVAMKKMENAGYIAGNPDDTALCWGCRWAGAEADTNGHRCPWASNLQLRSEWVENENYVVTIREPETGEKGIRVKKCQGFDLGYYQLEKKYVISILLEFYQKVSAEAFTKVFFVKAKTRVFDTWLKLFNDFRALIDFPPLVVIEPENYDDLTEEDLKRCGDDDGEELFK